MSHCTKNKEQNKSHLRFHSYYEMYGNANFYVNVILKEKLVARQRKKRANVLSENQNIGSNLRKCTVSPERTIVKELFEILGKLDLYRKNTRVIINFYW